MTASSKTIAATAETKEPLKQIIFPYFDTELKALNIQAGLDSIVKLLKQYDWNADKKIFLSTIKKRLSSKKIFTLPTQSEFYKSHDYETTKAFGLLFLAENGIPFLSSYIYMCKELDKVLYDQLCQDEKIYLLRRFYYCLNNPCSTDEIKAFIDLSICLKKTAGIDYFLILFSKPLKKIADAQVIFYIKIMQIIINLHALDNTYIHAVLKKNLPHLKVLVNELETIEINAARKKHPEEKIENIINRLGTISDFVKFPLNSEEIIQLKKEYALVESETKTLLTIPASALIEEAKKASVLLATNPQQLFRLLAIIREAMKHEFKNDAYPEQILSVLALLHVPEKMKGRVAKIRTGEGKSRTIAMLAAIHALQNHCVDIITANRYLAIRDQALFSNFFHLLGISSSHLCHDKLTKKDFDHLINYATHHDIEFSIMRDNTYGTDHRYTTIAGVCLPRPFKVCIVDESDTLFLDAQQNGARIAMGEAIDFSWIYHPILAFIKEKVGKEKLSMEELFSVKERLLTSELIDDAKSKLIKLAPNKKAEIELRTPKIKKWLHSAIKALYELERDRDYTVKMLTRESKTPQIIIIDSETTGRSSGDNCRWKNGLHEMLEIIHHLPVGRESLTCAAISHFSLFEKYEFITGLTGTVGSDIERTELLETYKVGNFDVSPRFVSQRIQHPARYFAEKKDYETAMINEIKEMQTQGRPTLVIFNTIKETKHFSDLLQNQGINPQVINETQVEDEEFLIRRAGRPRMVTVVTYTGGRGTDFILTKEALENGGLHVIFAAFPPNERPEEQGFGRAGRQGQPGSCRMFILEEHKFIQTLLKHNSSEEKAISLADDEKFREKLQEFRRKEIEKESKQRQVLCQLDAIQHSMLELFWKMLKFLRDALETMDLADLAATCTKILPTTETILLQGYPKIAESFMTELKPLQEQAHVLLAQQHNGSGVDWLSFLKQFKQEYLHIILVKWAHFFTRLEDIERITPQLYQKMLFTQFYQFMQEELHAQFAYPEVIFKYCLAQIIGENAQSILFNVKAKTRLARPAPADFIIKCLRTITELSNDCEISLDVCSDTFFKKLSVNSSAPKQESKLMKLTP